MKKSEFKAVHFINKDDLRIIFSQSKLTNLIHLFYVDGGTNYTSILTEEDFRSKYGWEGRIK